MKLNRIIITEFWI